AVGDPPVGQRDGGATQRARPGEVDAGPGRDGRRGVSLAERGTAPALAIRHGERVAGRTARAVFVRHPPTAPGPARTCPRAGPVTHGPCPSRTLSPAAAGPR